MGPNDESYGNFGARGLNVFLPDKDAVAQGIKQAIRRRGYELGLLAVSVGIEDVFLPGDMKELMNEFTEAKKCAEANLVAPPRNGRHAQPGQHGDAARRQPDVDAPM